MKQLLLVFYKALEEIRHSFKTSRSLITIKQRAGNRYMHVFVGTFALSILGVFNLSSRIELFSHQQRKGDRKQVP